MIDVAHSQEQTRIILERNEKELYIMAEFSFKNIFLAGVGATAYSFEKAQELVDDLVKKGELTVQQGKVVNEELRRPTLSRTRRAKLAACWTRWPI